jgi:hypothetical protein
MFKLLPTYVFYQHRMGKMGGANTPGLHTEIRSELGAVRSVQNRLFARRHIPSDGRQEGPPRVARLEEEQAPHGSARQGNRP